MSESAIAFIQKVAASHRAVCKADHHAGTCQGAVRLAEEAAKVLAGMGVALKYDPPPPAWATPCLLCGEGEYVIGQVWHRVWVHAVCESFLTLSDPVVSPGRTGANADYDKVHVRRDCLVGAHQTLDMVGRTLQHAESLDLARAALVHPVHERMLLLQEILESDDSGPAPRPLPGPEDPPDPVGLTSASGDE